MKSDIIQISSTGENMELALAQAAKVAAFNELEPRDSMHLRLLTEEMMGLMRSITGKTEGTFWIENDGKVYNLHLRVETITDAKMRSELLASSSSGKNEAARTLMGRLREFFFRNVDEEIANYRPPYLAVGIANPTLTPYTDWEWTLTRYQDAVSAGAKDNDREALDAWDELEKSVVSHVADDVKVSIKGWTTEMIIEKKLG